MIIQIVLCDRTTIVYTLRYNVEYEEFYLGDFAVKSENR